MCKSVSVESYRPTGSITTHTDGAVRIRTALSSCACAATHVVWVWLNCDSHDADTAGNSSWVFLMSIAQYLYLFYYYYYNCCIVITSVLVIKIFYALQHICHSAYTYMPCQFRPSVRLSHACFMAKWLNASSKFFHSLIRHTTVCACEGQKLTKTLVTNSLTISGWT